MKLPKSLLERARGGVALAAFGGALACAEPAPPIVVEPLPAPEPIVVVAALDPVEYDDAAESARLAGLDDVLASNDERRARRIAAATPNLGTIGSPGRFGHGWYGLGCGRG